MEPSKYHIGQMLRITHSWAHELPVRPVSDIQWDEHWNCYTYGFPLCLIRIEEEMLAPTEEPDMTSEQWEALSQEP